MTDFNGQIFRHVLYRSALRKIPKAVFFSISWRVLVGSVLMLMQEQKIDISPPFIEECKVVAKVQRLARHPN